MAQVKIPCMTCDVDRTVNPFCRKDCDKWKLYECDKEVEEFRRQHKFDSRQKWVKFEGRTGLRKKFAKR